MNPTSAAESGFTDLLSEPVRPPEAKVILARAQADEKVLEILAWDIVTSDVPRLAKTVIDVTGERDTTRTALAVARAQRDALDMQLQEALGLRGGPETPAPCGDGRCYCGGCVL